MGRMRTDEDGRYNLVGIDGNAWNVMGYVTGAMKDAYREANQGNSDPYDVLANKLFNKEAQTAYTNDCMSSDYNHLLCKSIEMIDKVNEYFDGNPDFLKTEV